MGNIATNLFITDLSPAIMAAFNGPIEFSSLHPMPERVKVAECLRLFDEAVANGSSTRWALFRVGRSDMIISAFCQLLNVGAQVGTPLLMYQLIDAVQRREFSGLYWALGTFASMLFGLYMNQIHLYFVETAAIRIRAAAASAVFRKIVGMRQHTTSVTYGAAASTVATETQRLLDVASQIHLLWASPLQISLSAYIMVSFISLPALVGLAVILVVYPLSLLVSRVQAAIRVKAMVHTKERVEKVVEFIQGIRVAKTNAWEPLLLAQIRRVRSEELSYLIGDLACFVIVGALLIIIAQFAALGAFGVFVDTVGTLDPVATFATLNVLTITKFPVMYFGNALMGALQLRTAMTHVVDLIESRDELHEGGLITDLDDGGSKVKEEEFDVGSGGGNASSSSSEPHQQREQSSPGVVSSSGQDIPMEVLSSTKNEQKLSVFQDATVVWSAVKKKESSDESTSSTGAAPNSSSTTPTQAPEGSKRAFKIGPCNVTWEKGKVYAVVGAVGSGKSLLLHALLGEAHLANGLIQRRGDIAVAYAGQEAALISATIRDNIVFFGESDRKRIDICIAACQLGPDLATMDEGEDTVVGERGVTLSGGQKARIAVARAVYAADKCDLIVLDDPFSALDVRTGKAMLAALLGAHDSPNHEGGLLSQNCVVVSTHSEAVKRYADYLITCNALDGSVMVEPCNRAVSSDAAISTPTTVEPPATNARPGGSTALMTQEKLSNSVTQETYKFYLKNLGGARFLVSIILGLVCERFCFIVVDIWLSVWTSASKGKPTHSMGRVLDLPSGATREGARFYLITYAVLICITLLLGNLRISIVSFGGHRATRLIAEKALRAVSRAPMVFFETTPTGRIVNRLTHDVDRISFSLIIQINTMFASLGWLLTGIVITATVVPWTLFSTIPPTLAVYGLLFLFRRCNMQFQQFDAVSRSAMQGTMYEALNGSTTVRAYKMVTHFMVAIQGYIDESSLSLYNATRLQRWLAVRAEFFAALCFGMTAIVVWIVRDSLTPGDVGLALVSCNYISRTFGFLMTDVAQGEAKLVSAERLREFIGSLDVEEKEEFATTVVGQEGVDQQRCDRAARQSEPLAVISNGDKTAATTAAIGLDGPQPIIFEHVFMRYRPSLPLVLNGCSFTIQARHRVGVVGRTGSGKSSLTVALFRLRELESGRILIGEHDISKIPLSSLRSGGLVTVPQDPFLFKGTLRSNVDPFQLYADQDIIDAFEKVQLGAFVGQHGIQYPVMDRGSNLSVGQRQLVCIARAIVRKPTVLVLDEATANIDSDTDAVIQHVVRTCFPETTIIEIAHRLDSVIDADRILVMSQGSVIEFGSPEELLKLPFGHFAGMVSSMHQEHATHMAK